MSEPRTHATRRTPAVAALLGVVLLAGCASKVDLARPVTPVTGPAPVLAVTQMEEALRCLTQHYPPSADLRLGVNDLTDGTGSTLSGDSLSKVLTQRPDMMMIIALAKTGARVVNRSSTGVAEWELRQSMQKYIGDGRARINPATKEPIPYRPILAGAVLGSTHYVSGAITELNWNLHSDVNEFGIGGLSFGSRRYSISIAIDLLVTNTVSTEVVFARSYSKQLVGRELSAGLFRFFDVGAGSRNWGPKEVFEFNLGRQANEPVQTAVRWMIENAAYDIVSGLSGVGAVCDPLLPEGSRPTRPGAATVAAAPAPAGSAAPTASGSGTTGTVGTAGTSGTPAIPTGAPGAVAATPPSGSPAPPAVATALPAPGRGSLQAAPSLSLAPAVIAVAPGAAPSSAAASPPPAASAPQSAAATPGAATPPAEAASTAPSTSAVPAVVPAVVAAPSPAPRRAPPPAPVNQIDGVNLFEEDGEIIVRIDLRVPATTVPTLQGDDPKAPVFVFERVRNAVGTLAPLKSDSVKSVALADAEGSARLAIELTQPLAYNIERNGRSLLILFRRQTAAKPEALPTAADAARAKDGAATTVGADKATTEKAGSSVGGSVESAGLLAPTKTPDPLSPEVLKQTGKR